jgi:hypothetical protein
VAAAILASWQCHTTLEKTVDLTPDAVASFPGIGGGTARMKVQVVDAATTYGASSHSQPWRAGYSRQQRRSADVGKAGVMSAKRSENKEMLHHEVDSSHGELWADLHS